MNNYGEGIQDNKKEAAKYLQMSVGKRNDVAITNYVEANKYNKMFADKGNENRMRYYALMNYIGDGIPENRAEASKYFKMAADKGDLESKIFYAGLNS